MMNRWVAIAAFAATGCRVAAVGPSTPADFATRVIVYSGANGAPGYNTHPENALGPPSTAATPDVPDNTSLFSFGAGGSIILGFDVPITHDPRHPGGYDFIIFGNAFYAGGDPTMPFREPGYVEVGVDPTGLHQFGDGSQVKWYWLKGTPAPTAVAGFPMEMPASTVPTTGYADCTPTDGTGDPLIPSDPALVGITPGSAGGDAFSLAWAVDVNGAPATLSSVDFVRINCAVKGLTSLGLAYSTEVDAVALVRPRVPGDVDFDGAVSLDDACLVAGSIKGRAVLTTEQELRADVTGHTGPPTIADAARIMALAAGLI